MLQGFNVMMESTNNGSSSNVRHKKNKLYECIFCGAYTIYLFVSVIGTSLLGDSLGITAESINTMKHIVAVLIVLSILVSIKLNRKLIILIAGFGLVSIMVYLKMGAFNPILSVLFLFGCRKCNPKKVCKIHLYCVSISLAIIFASAILGIIDNIELSRESSIYTVARYGMGFKNATWFGYIFNLFVDYFYIKLQYKNKKIKQSEYLTVIFLAIVSFYLSKGRLELISTFLLIIAIKNIDMLSKNKTMKKLLVFSFIIMIALSFATTYLYVSGNSIAQSINRALNSRLRFNAMGYSKYGISLFGNYVEMQGASQTTAENWQNYFYIDNFYVSYLIQYGIIWIALALIFLTLINAKLVKEKKDVMLVFMSIVALQGFVIPTMMDFISSCTILVAFIEIGTLSKKPYFFKRITQYQKIA